MKFIVYVFAIAITMSSFAQASYRLTDKQPKDSKYTCLVKTDLVKNKYGNYAFVALPEYQNNENKGVYFNTLGSDKNCVRNDIYGWYCVKSEGTVDPVNLANAICRTMLPARCEPKLQDTLVQNGQTLVQTHQDQWGQTVCTYAQE